MIYIIEYGEFAPQCRIIAEISARLLSPSCHRLCISECLHFGPFTRLIRVNVDL